MRININKKILLFADCFFIIIMTVLIIILFYGFNSNDKRLGGTLRENENVMPQSLHVDSQQMDDYSERYQRPSKQAAISNPYTLQSFMQGEKSLIFQSPEDVIYAYFGILKEASNMIGYSGGCGTIGEADIPYPYAYQLLTPQARKKMSLKKFKDSFKGIGHITLLQVRVLPSPPETPADTNYFMVEIEEITGRPVKSVSARSEDQTNHFSYYYGIVTVKNGENGWKIQEIDYYPEEFLCAPYHGWFYEAEAMADIVFKDNLKVIEQIMNKTEKDGMIYIYASGNERQFRFDFVRLTNGYDVLINENVMVDGKWKSTELLTEDWISLKVKKSK